MWEICIILDENNLQFLFYYKDVQQLCGRILEMVVFGKVQEELYVLANLFL